MLNQEVYGIDKKRTEKAAYLTNEQQKLCYKERTMQVYKYIAEIISLSVLTVKIKNFITQRSVKSVSLIMYVI